MESSQPVVESPWLQERASIDQSVPLLLSALVSPNGGVLRQ